MPISRENRPRYPAEWPDIRASVRTRATAADGVTRCERCCKPDRTHVLCAWDGSGRWLDDTTWRGPDGQPAAAPELGCLHLTKVVLTVAHLDHRPEHNAPQNLACLCQGCHLRHDRRLHSARRRQNHQRRQARSQPALPEFDLCVCPLCNEAFTVDNPGLCVGVEPVAKKAWRAILWCERCTKANPPPNIPERPSARKRRRKDAEQA
jgi:hypothetical protein